MRIHEAVRSQLADVRAWAKTGSTPDEFSLLDYVHCIGTPDSLFAYADLFAPDMIVHDGMHFHAAGFSVEVYNQWIARGTSRRETQRVMNHVHVTSLMQGAEITDEIAVEAARVIAAIWALTLAPLHVAVEHFGDTVEDAAVTFYDPT